MFLRFIGIEKDKRIGYSKGIFTISYELLDEGELLSYEEEILNELLKWFKINLPIPTNFSRKKNGAHKQSHGVSWIREENKAILTKL